jgi:acyl-CoA thioesterase I
MVTAVSMQTDPLEGKQRNVLIRIYGDSLGMPRSSERIGYLDTFGERLREQIEQGAPSSRVSVYNRSRGGAPISTLFEDFKTDSFFFGTPGGTVLIIQAGVVDCAPRPLSRFLRRGVALLPPSPQARVIGFLHDHRAAILRKGIAWRATSPRDFAAVYSEWLQVACRTFEWVYAVNIAPTNPAIETRSPGFGDSVVYYNSIIERACRTVGADNVRLVDVHTAILESDDGVRRYINVNDGHHITTEGHRLYTELLTNMLREDRALGLAPIRVDIQ